MYRRFDTSALQSLPPQKSTSYLAQPHAPSPRLDLPHNRCISNLRIRSQEQRLAQDDRQHTVPLKGQEELAGGVVGRTAGGDNTEILVIRLHEDIATAQVDLVRAQIALDHQKLVAQRAAVADLECRQEEFQRLPPRLGGLGEVAKGIAVPVGDMGAFLTPIHPVRVIADAGDADKEVNIAQDLGEDQRWDRGQRQRIGRGHPPTTVTATAGVG